MTSLIFGLLMLGSTSISQLEPFPVSELSAVNPANIALKRAMSFSAFVRDSNDYAIWMQFNPSFGFGYEQNPNIALHKSLYRFTLGIPLSDYFQFGAEYIYAHEPKEFYWRFGANYLLTPWLRLTYIGDHYNHQGVTFRNNFGVTLYPGTDRIALFGTADLVKENFAKQYSMGLDLKLADGVELIGAYDSDKNISVAMKLHFGNVAMSSGAVQPSKDNADMDYSGFLMTFETMHHKTIFEAANKKWVLLKLQGPLTDSPNFSALFTQSETNIGKIKEIIRAADAAKDVGGILLDLDNVSNSSIGPIGGSLEELYTELMEFRAKGNHIVAYIGTTPTLEDYYLATAAEKIISPELNTFMVLGSAIELSRMKDFWNKFGFEYEYYTAGKYKSTFHTAMTDSATEDQKQLIQALLDDQYSRFADAVHKARGIKPDSLEAIAEMLPINMDAALKYGLIDTIGWLTTAKDIAAELTGAKDFVEVNLKNRPEYRNEILKPRKKVLVIRGYGGISSGDSEFDYIFGGYIMGSRTIVKQIDNAAKNNNIAAVVFRINSGGGSALASEEIADAIRRYKEDSKKPFIVSMSDVAASGGYWIACEADTIVANTNTITGSIGVVGAKMVLDKLADTLRIHRESYTTNPSADMWSAGRRFTDDERQRFEGMIDDYYTKFITKVSKTRDLTVEMADSLGQGKVYTGNQALQAKLIDSIGGLDEAVSIAKEMAGVHKDSQITFAPILDDAIISPELIQKVLLLLK